MKCIDEISNEITIISIAHRHSTLKNCDRIVELKKWIILFHNDPDQIL